MGFQQPEAFYLLIFLVPIGFIMWTSKRYSLSVISGLKGSLPEKYYYLARTTLVMLLIASLVAVIARPYSRLQRTADYIFLVDVSRSMQATKDCSQPSYLDRAKDVMRAVISGVPEGRFGIFVYERLAFPVTHLTYDHAYLQTVIDNGIYDGVIFDRTASRLGNALLTLVDKKKRMPDAFGGLNTVVLLSDGNLNQDMLQVLAEPVKAAADIGLTIVPVAIGNTDPTPIPTREDDNCVDKFIVKDGILVTVSLQTESLRYIADATSGRFFGEAELTGLVSYLREETLKQTFIDTGLTQRQRKDTSWVFLLISTLALFGYMLIDLNPGSLLYRKIRHGRDDKDL